MNHPTSGPWTLPVQWEWSAFADAAEIAQDLVQPSEVPNAPHVAPDNIESRTRRLLPFRTVEEDRVISPKQRFFAGQVLFTKIRPYLLKSVLADFDGVCSADMYPLWPKGADARYLLYWLTSAEFRDIIAFDQGRSVLPKINQSSLNATPIPLPPLDEQRRIVAKIDTFSGKSKRARDHLDHVPRLVEKYKQAILTSAFKGELTHDWRSTHSDVLPVQPTSVQEKRRLDQNLDGSFEPPYDVPHSWRWLALPQLGSLDRGKSRHRPRNDPKLFDGPYPFVQTGDVRQADRYLTTFTETYSELGLAQSRLWPKGTLCITIAANIAETAILGIDACFPDSVVGFLPAPECASTQYVEFFIRTVRERIESFAPATAQKNINLSTLGTVYVPVPPIAEQAEIVRRIENAFAWIDRLASEATSARKLIDRLDQAILSKAFRGELVPQDPNDEPASVLLERIRAERPLGKYKSKGKS